MSIEPTWLAILILGCCNVYCIAAVLTLRAQLTLLPNHGDLSETNQRLARVETKLENLAANVETLIKLMQVRE